MSSTAPHPLIERWSTWPQLLFHQAGWWACVIWMGWLGPMVMLAFLAAHLTFTRRRIRQELVIITAATLTGIALDSALAITGAVSYVGELKVWAAPLWLVSIWAGFGATLMHSQSVLVRSRTIAVLTGLLGGPAAYWGGERLSRMTVQPEIGWMAVSATWTIALLLLCEISLHLRAN